MIKERCPWGLLFGGDFFYIFFMKEINNGDDVYYRMHYSMRHNTIQPGPSPEPDIFKVCIAMLLGDAESGAHNTVDRLRRCD